MENTAIPESDDVVRRFFEARKRKRVWIIIAVVVAIVVIVGVILGLKFGGVF
jgi:t-SNARE complex subunit (syntaxin)